MKRLWLILAFMAFFSVNAQKPANAVNSFTNAITTMEDGARVSGFHFQPDGKIIVVGYFEFSDSPRQSIMRLNNDGTIDPTYNTGTGFISSSVPVSVMQPDGKVIIAGDFSSYNGTDIKDIARINTDGSLDTSFNPGTSTDFGSIHALKLLSDGRIMIGGQFSTFNGTNAKRMAILQTNGTIDTSFVNGLDGDDVYILAITQQPNGKLLIGGNFLSYNGVTANRMMRLNLDGSLDTSFNLSEVSFGPLAPYTFAVQPDGKILVGGGFNYFNGQVSRKLLRLNADGTKDTSFQAYNFDENESIKSITLKTNGKIVIGGEFTIIIGGNSATYDVAVLESNGIVDPTFKTEFTWGSGGDGVYNVTLSPDGYVYVGGYFESYGSVSVNSYVKLLGTDYYRFEGNTKINLNNMGCAQSNLTYPNMKFEISNGTSNEQFYGNNLGDHVVYLKNGTNVVTPVLQNPSYFTVNPTQIEITYPTGADQASNQSFCLTPNGTHNDLQVTMVPLNPAVPGFTAKYLITYTNPGNTIQSGQINLQYNTPILILTASNPAVTNQSSGNFIWAFENLKPLETRTIELSLTLNTPTAEPPVHGGDVLGYTAVINSAQTDETPGDNTFNLNQTVVNSMDPNDKTCLEGTSVSTAKIGEYLHYLIRFENTGTFHAQDVIVKDVIDTTKFDITSLQPISGSHKFITRITNGNLVEFIFQNIMLPFEDETNDGYVSFRIKTLPTLTVDDSFSNTASIYFDYNEPIITNTATTDIHVLSNADFIMGDFFKIYPNPANTILTISSISDIEIDNVYIYSISGQLLISQPIRSNQALLDVSGLPQGNYFVKMLTEKGFTASKFIKM